MRHLVSGVDCAIAGAAIVAPATPTPVALMKSRRFMEFPPLGDVSVCRRLRLEACPQHGTSGSGFPCRTEVPQRKKPGLRRRPGFAIYDLRLSLGLPISRVCASGS